MRQVSSIGKGEMKRTKPNIICPLARALHTPAQHHRRVHLEVDGAMLKLPNMGNVAMAS